MRLAISLVSARTVMEAAAVEVAAGDEAVEEAEEVCVGMGNVASVQWCLAGLPLEK